MYHHLNFCSPCHSVVTIYTVESNKNTRTLQARYLVRNEKYANFWNQYKQDRNNYNLVLCFFFSFSCCVSGPLACSDSEFVLNNLQVLVALLLWGSAHRRWPEGNTRL
jgi:hypothetical protein